MALERLGAQHNAVVDKYHDPTADYTMSVRDYVVRPSASAAITITLPKVSLAKGRTYTIIARLASAVNTITVEDNSGDSEAWQGDFVMKLTADRLLFYSDGLAWFEIIKDLTA